ncbi:helix-turn-helix domain-containing protein [Mesorhizobium sp.]|uniref:helix-turn-helix transcriptional regulator n=1 Tax=Mesorhizobium sp. TaxID=1871066 RepID=UPI00121F61C4|nr:helix-turn-helix domain-containing protein [Mesorhizobium sp.]TIQ44618.1 MAG: helix-turn-helix domain-containing protein [Mesorhizobium sp.]TIQ54352.1 MAG: helix-turn-helix domain-containing protein [Mesorhizobium sp.]
METLPQILRTDDAARYVGISPSTLSKMRLRGEGPPYAKIGKRIVVYDKGDLAHWLASMRRLSTVR